jgi:anti-sigma factor RsiW
MTHRDVPCQELVELLTDYLEGVLDGLVAREVAEHLAACEGCGAYLDQMTAILTSLRALPAEPVPEELQLTVAAVIRASAAR